MRGSDADADDHEVAVEHLGRRWCGPARRLAVALEGLDAVAQQHPDPVVGVDVAIEGADLGAEHALERHARADR